MTLLELKAIVDSLVALHTGARVDFVYPIKRGDKKISKLGDITGYEILHPSDPKPIARFVLEHARSSSVEAEPKP